MTKTKLSWFHKPGPEHGTQTEGWGDSGKSCCREKVERHWRREDVGCQKQTAERRKRSWEGWITTRRSRKDWDEPPELRLRAGSRSMFVGSRWSTWENMKKWIFTRDQHLVHTWCVCKMCNSSACRWRDNVRSFRRSLARPEPTKT